MTTMICPATHATIKNSGIRAQADFTTACGLPYSKHDGNGFDRASDVTYMGHNISVKARHFTLMSATLCEGKTTLADIWEVYERKTHSDLFAYIVNEIAYIMTLAEFREFVMRYCEVERESNHSDRKGEGLVKVRAKRNEGDMVKWFNAKLSA